MLLGLVSAVASLLPAVPALASGQQLSVFEDDAHLQGNPEATLAVLRSLGVGVIRVSVPWGRVAPASLPAHFQPSDPGDPNYNWAIFDQIDRAARASGITADFTLDTPAPRGRWPAVSLRGAGRTDSGSRMPPNLGRSSAPRAPATAAVTPRRVRARRCREISFWAIWNEPNFGQDLAPPGDEGVKRSLRPDLVPDAARRCVDLAHGDRPLPRHDPDRESCRSGHPLAGVEGPPGRTPRQLWDDEATAVPPGALLRRLAQPTPEGVSRLRGELPHECLGRETVPRRPSCALLRDRVCRASVSGQPAAEPA